LKPERWGSPLVQEKYQEEKSCDKRHPCRIIIIIIIIQFFSSRLFNSLLIIAGTTATRPITETVQEHKANTKRQSTNEIMYKSV